MARCQGEASVGTTFHLGAIAHTEPEPTTGSSPKHRERAHVVGVSSERAHGQGSLHGTLRTGQNDRTPAEASIDGEQLSRQAGLALVCALRGGRVCSQEGALRRPGNSARIACCVLCSWHTLAVQS